MNAILRKLSILCLVLVLTGAAWANCGKSGCCGSSKSDDKKACEDKDKDSSDDKKADSDKSESKSSDSDKADDKAD